MPVHKSCYGATRWYNHAGTDRCMLVLIRAMVLRRWYYWTGRAGRPNSSSTVTPRRSPSTLDPRP
eukprot:2667012-Rhodomonas_salina.1